MKLPAGTYYIGDPCYVIPNADWDKFLVALDRGDSEFQGKPFFCDNTRYGDGGYYDNFGKEYSVDAGLLAAIPVELVSFSKYSENRINELGLFVTFDKEFAVDCSDGVFTFGHITIDTGYDDAYEESYDWDEDE